MAKYSISYSRPGEPPAIWELEAKSEGEARLRFLNLSWVAFTAISVNSIALKGAQPEAAKAAVQRKRPGPAEAFKLTPAANAVKAAADRAEADPRKVVVSGGGRNMGKTYARALTDIPAEIERLGGLINELADEAQALTRAGDHDKADAKRASAKKLAADRLALTKRIKGK